MKVIQLLTVVPVFLLVSACTSTSEKKTEQATQSPLITSEDWGKVDDKSVSLYSLTNADSVVVKITNYGGIITEWLVPDRNGKRENIVLGFTSLEKYLAAHPYFGAIIGRYGNRIAKGTFDIDKQTFVLEKNDGNNHLHGGLRGFDKRVWKATADTTGGQASLKLEYTSADGEEGYPGTLVTTVTYTLTPTNELVITYEATTDKATPVNLTNHAYFNLTGSNQNTILEHTLTLNANAYTPVDSELIPTGKIDDVRGTPFDFTTPQKIGARISQVPGGYDHNFVLTRSGQSSELAAVLYDSASGRMIETYTTEPGIQFYSGNFLDGSLLDSEGRPIQKHTGLCLETQHFPNSPNVASFPTTLLQPGGTYRSETRYAFKIK